MELPQKDISFGVPLYFIVNDLFLREEYTYLFFDDDFKLCVEIKSLHGWASLQQDSNNRY